MFRSGSSAAKNNPPKLTTKRKSRKLAQSCCRLYICETHDLTYDDQNFYMTMRFIVTQISRDAVCMQAKYQGNYQQQIIETQKL